MGEIQIPEFYVILVEPKYPGNIGAIARSMANFDFEKLHLVKPCKLDDELGNLAVNAAGVIGCKVAGVDILEGPEGPMIVELNSQPGWRGLQSVTKANIADAIIEYILLELKGK